MGHDSTRVWVGDDDGNLESSITDEADEVVFGGTDTFSV
jgi:hypothetical protein